MNDKCWVISENMQASEKKFEANSNGRHLQPVAKNINLAVAALTKNAQDRSKIALIWESASGRREVFPFFEIENLSNKIANVLADLNVNVGDRVFTLLSRTPELYAAIPAVLKLGAAIGVLFPDFGSEAVRQRLDDSGAKVLITSQNGFEKIKSVCALLPNLEHILIVGGKREKKTSVRSKFTISMN